MKRLIIKGFINPIWLNDISYEEKGIVTEKGTIMVKGQELHLTEEDDKLSFGDEVFVYRSNHFYYETKKEKEEKEKQILLLMEQEKQDNIKREEKRIKEALEFNQSLNVPVKWVSEIKPVLSGLTETSFGDGAKRNTVFHVLLQEDIDEGRFKRKAGDFLCTAKSNNNGRYSELRDIEKGVSAASEKGEIFKRKVTCKACIKATNRWR